MRRNKIDRAEIFSEIELERARQDRIHPMPEYKDVDNPEVGAMLKLLLSSDLLAVLVEEVGEVGRALQGEPDSTLKVELIQTASVCVRWLERL